MCDYGSLKYCAVPGGLGDSGDYNIDGRCFTESFDHELLSSGKKSADGEISCGKIVNVASIVDGYKEISSIFDQTTRYDVPYGVALHSPLATVHATGVYDSELLHYPPDEPISVITHGRAWVLTNTMTQAPAFGSRVYVSQFGFAQNNGSRHIAGWYFTGGFVKFSNVYNLVEIHIEQSAGHLDETNHIPVNGIHISRTPTAATIPTNTDVQITVQVSPAGATNKEIVWHVVEGSDVAGSVEKRADNLYQFVPVRNYVGDVHLIAEAADGSGVQGMTEWAYTTTKEAE